MSAVMLARGLRPAAELAKDRPCGDRLRYVAGCRCDDCRAANAAYERERIKARAAGDWNGLVPAEKARAHIRKLSRQGVGRRAIGAASDVGDTTLSKIRSGRKLQIRARTERAILAVTRAMASDHSLVSAARTWQRIDLLIDEGYTEAFLAKELGYTNPYLQLGRDQVTVRNAYEVERLYQRLTS
jgi:hypothetical protein